ncbi:hypothetical protein AAHA92_22371 [Salvia divinorum]|uniref:Uncharacterized protein n=1 Tax=Salvia divinorum TaxID=28513 RepID=A0ABD1GRM1_SALDI
MWPHFRPLDRSTRRVPNLVGVHHRRATRACGRCPLLQGVEPPEFAASSPPSRESGCHRRPAVSPASPPHTPTTQHRWPALSPPISDPAGLHRCRGTRLLKLLLPLPRSLGSAADVQTNNLQLEEYTWERGTWNVWEYQ